MNAQGGEGVDGRPHPFASAFEPEAAADQTFAGWKESV
jgi:hypothetical protein